METRKDFFNLTQDIFICSVYIPPQNSPREHRLNINHFETLQNYISLYSNLNFSIYNNSSGPVDYQNSQDSNTNVYGRALIKLCCENSLITLNGRTRGDFVGHVTLIMDQVL